MTEKIVLASDLGGTNLRMAAVTETGEILYRTRRSTPRAESAGAIILKIVEAANECRENVARFGEIKSLAVAAPATVNAEKGIILKAPNVPCLSGFHLTAALSKELGLPVILENDANAAAIGEQAFGAAKNFQDAIVVTLGTGVGGGIIIGGRIVRGRDGTAGEIGHICVEPEGVPCGCGSRGCLEQYSSATAIVRLARELANRFPNSVLPDKSGLTSADIYAAGVGGDELARQAFRRMGFYLGIALAGLINVLNPEIIVIGGGASAGWDLFIPAVEEQIELRAYPEPAKRAQLARAVLGDAAGILGAAHLAWLCGCG